MAKELEFLDLDLELPNSKEALKRYYADGWVFVYGYPRNLNDGKRDFFRHCIILSRELTPKEGDICQFCGEPVFCPCDAGLEKGVGT